MVAIALKKRCGEETRQRILEAALARFACASYEGVKLRDIAEDVGVDVALVHRAFGSKEKLFAEALTAAGQFEHLLTSDAKDMSAVLTNYVFEADSGDISKRRTAIEIFVHSLTSPQARDVLRVHAVSDFIAPLAANLGSPSLQRAALILSSIVGISVLRNVLQIETLLDASKLESQPLIEKIFRACLDEGDADQTAHSPCAEQP